MKATGNNKYTGLSVDEIREEVYNEYIQEYYHLSHEEITELVDEKMLIIFFGEKFMNSNDKGEIKTY
jgi:hypothetical protein